jgi:predicted O-methyltransferase YrrM
MAEESEKARESEKVPESEKAPVSEKPPESDKSPEAQKRAHEAEKARAREHVLAKQRQFIAAIGAFKKVAGHLPAFLLDDNLGSIPQEYLRNCRVATDRIEMLRHLPKGGRVAEVGVFRGAFSYQILDILAPDEFLTIDISYESFDYDKLSQHPLYSRMLQVTGNSYDKIAELPDNSFDMIYIDADHRYGYAKKDLDAAHPKLKAGGYLLANDYTSWSVMQGFKYGVVKAVNQFVNENKYDVEWFALHGSGYCDVAMKKPG